MFAPRQPNRFLLPIVLIAVAIATIADYYHKHFDMPTPIKFDPAAARRSMDIANEMTRERVHFVPVPVFTDEQRKAAVALATENCDRATNQLATCPSKF